MTTERAARRPTTVAEHQRQLESVRWATVQDLAARWRLSDKTIRRIPREALPYLEFGKSKVRRYSPASVESYETRAGQ